MDQAYSSEGQSFFTSQKNANGVVGAAGDLRVKRSPNGYQRTSGVRILKACYRVPRDSPLSLLSAGMSQAQATVFFKSSPEHCGAQLKLKTTGLGSLSLPGLTRPSANPPCAFSMCFQVSSKCYHHTCPSSGITGVPE